MSTLEIQCTHLCIPLRTRFKHASAERRVADSLWVEVRRGEHIGFGEGCPRDYVTGESAETSLAWLTELCPALTREIKNVVDLRAWVAAHRAEIDRHPAAWCAVELALLDLFGKESAQPVEHLLGMKAYRGPFRYTAVVGDEAYTETEKKLRLYLDVGFSDFKFKVSGEIKADRARMQRLFTLCRERNLPAPRLRIDANNLWAKQPDIARNFLAELNLPLCAVEEPLAPRATAALSELSVATALPIILDESLCRCEDLACFAALPGHWIGNVRISKLGGLLRSLEVIRRLRALGWPVIVGAQVGETSVLTRAATVAAQAAGDALVAQEGAFGTLLLTHDVVEPVLMFGRGGELLLPAAPDGTLLPGFGLERTSAPFENSRDASGSRLGEVAATS